MIKYFQIDSIRKDQKPGKEFGWTTFSYQPVSNALGYLVEAGQKYREGQPKKWYIKPIEVSITGVYDETRAFIRIKGREKDIEDFLQKTTLVKNFNDYWSWGEVEKWRMELRLTRI